MLETCVRSRGRRIGGAIPRRVKRGFDVHNFIAHLEEMLSRQRLGEKVRDVVSCGYEWNANLAVLNALSEEEMTPFDVFHPGIVFRVLR